MKNIRVIQELHEMGITGYHEVVYNPSYEELFKAETSTKNQGFEKGAVTDLGTVAVKTGIFTGRSPKDRYIVEDEVTKDTICWDGKVVLGAWDVRKADIDELYVLVLNKLDDVLHCLERHVCLLVVDR